MICAHEACAADRGCLTKQMQLENLILEKGGEFWGNSQGGSTVHTQDRINCNPENAK